MEGSSSTNPAASRAKAFEVFVKRTISQIHKEAWGRSKEVRDLRDACDKFLSAIEGTDSKLPELEDMVLQVLPPLHFACQTNIPKVVELSLGCLHKLVAHAWLQGESQLSIVEPAQRKDSIVGSGQRSDVVAEVIDMVIKHADSNSQTLQLAVLRALLTFTTADHFVPHGDCLLSAVRTVFNLALSSVDSDIKRTAGNALLQMLNTITRRVTQYHMRSSRFSDTSSAVSTPVSRDAVAAAATAEKEIRGSRLTTAGSMEVEAELMSDQERAAQFKRMAEQRDMRGLERALEEAAARAAAEEAEAEAAGQGHAASESLPASPLPPATAASPSAPVTAASPPADSAGFTAMPNLPPLKTGSKLQRAPLTMPEKDVLLVLTAFCKLASCEPEKTNAEAYMQHGKLLALELLVKVLQNPHHNWSNVRDELFRHLRQPLCLALLKNCATGDPQAFNLAVKLLVAMLLMPKLRRGLRAEMGALYPLLILRAIEQYAGGWQEGAVDSAALLQLLQALRSLCSDAQLLVDLFVNYDCDLNAANLYERTISALSRLCSTPHEANNTSSNSAQAKEAATTAAVSDAALQCLQAVISSLDAWAGPIKDSLARSNLDTLADPAPEGESESSGSPSSKTEAEVFGAAKAHKSSLIKGIQLFKNNPLKGVAFLISTGVIERSPVKVAEFLISHLPQLNKTSLGEYLGHHEEFETQVMHAFVDRQRYAGVKIDIALRALLEQFRLPGEAQKIDRIMEKFAERYCKDNPRMFKTADEAYMLAFSIIMLNTDAHNPMAERRLNKASFVEMNKQQADKDYEPVLPVEELEGIYERIVSNEITLKGEGNDSRKSHQFVLAAAMGLTQLVSPFRALAASFQSKQSSAQLERIAILRQAEQALAQGTLSSVTWHIATHAEHTCPMLQVTGSMIFEALQWSLSNSTDVKQVEGILSSLAVLIKLTSLLGLDTLCEKCVAAVSQASGVYCPALPGSRQELIQLRAFKVLVGLPLSSEGGLLGSSWPIVLRCFSAVEALQLEHLRALQQPVKTEDSSSSKSLTKMFQALSFSINSTLGIKKPSTPTGSTGDETLDDKGEKRHVKDAPAIVLWAETEGITMLERIYSQSALLDGESVVVFVRALSAVSQEELELDEPRLFSLHKLVECAFHNMSRIRLVWSKVWSVVSSHLVGASCHPNSRVAMYAVDSLKQLVTKLLSRAELANFTHQEEALRPFVSILRQSDHATVRELTIQCVVQAATAHPRGLGSGWRTVIEAVARGVKDAAQPVVLQAMEALQMVVGGLYLGPGVGHECFMECLNAILAAIRNPHNTLLAPAAVQLLMLCAQRLADCYPPEGPRLYSEEVLAGWAPLLKALVDLLSSDPRPPVVAACMDGLYHMMQDFSQCWDSKTWEVVLNQVLDILFRLPSVDVLADPEEELAVVEVFTTRCERFVPRICDRITLIDERVGGDLLQRLVGMALAWTSHPSWRLSAAGLQSFEQMVLCLSHHLATPSWLLVLSSLRVCVQALLNQMLAQFRQLLEIHTATGLFLKPLDPSTPLDEHSLLLSNFHNRCQLVLLLQRCLGSIHEKCRAYMDAEVQLQLLQILKSTVDTAVSINHMSTSVLLPAMPAPVAPTLASTNKHTPIQPSPSIKANRGPLRNNSKHEDLEHAGNAQAVAGQSGASTKARSAAPSVEGGSPSAADRRGSHLPTANGTQQEVVSDSANQKQSNSMPGDQTEGTALAATTDHEATGNGNSANGRNSKPGETENKLPSRSNGLTVDIEAANKVGNPVNLADLHAVTPSPSTALPRPTDDRPISPGESSIVWSLTSPGSAMQRAADSEYMVTPRTDAMRLAGTYSNMPEGFAGLPPVATGSGPVVRSSPVGSDTVAPAVLRMEVQGGLMLIQAYKRALSLSHATELGLRVDATALGVKRAKMETELLSPVMTQRLSTDLEVIASAKDVITTTSSSTKEHQGYAATSAVHEEVVAGGASPADAGPSTSTPARNTHLSVHTPASPLSPRPEAPLLSDDQPLWDFCHDIITRASQTADRFPSGSTSTSTSSTHTGERSRESKLTERAPRLCGWYRDAHAPLIGSALEVLQELKHGGSSNKWVGLFPVLVSLIQYRHPLIQTALSELFEVKLGPLIAAACDAA